MSRTDVTVIRARPVRMTCLCGIAGHRGYVGVRSPVGASLLANDGFASKLAPTQSHEL
jgi:hypothetical protein